MAVITMIIKLVLLAVIEDIGIIRVFIMVIVIAIALEKSSPQKNYFELK